MKQVPAVAGSKMIEGGSDTSSEGILRVTWHDGKNTGAAPPYTNGMAFVSTLFRPSAKLSGYQTSGTGRLAATRDQAQQAETAEHHPPCAGFRNRRDVDVAAEAAA